MLFAIVFFWTPPHFWALSIKYREDYARADVPMLPVVATLARQRTQIFWYAVALVPVSLLLVATGTVSWIYGASAVVLGAAFVWQAYRLRRELTVGAAMSVFKDEHLLPGAPLPDDGRRSAVARLSLQCRMSP